MSRTRAFTLIELLIAVAIIGILAAIAVPNFLGALMRSKVARVFADMRSIETAIESYHLDHGRYAHVIIGVGLTSRDGLPVSQSLRYQFMFTTPVAYLSTTNVMNPFDDFRKVRRAPGSPVMDAPSTYGGSYSYSNRRQYSGLASEKDQWMLVTHGPTSILIYPGFPKNKLNSVTYDLNDFRSRVYSSSNGMVSEGNVTRLGGDLSGFEKLVPTSHP